jgi:transcriptional regulator with XRE-family HTH domain
VSTHTTTLADRLVEARNAKDLTTAQLARRVGVKTGTLRNWETGASEPRPNRLAMLAGVLDVSISWLLEGAAIYRPSHISATRADMIAHKLERAKAIQEDLARLMAEIADEVDALRREDAMEDELAA